MDSIPEDVRTVRFKDADHDDRYYLNDLIEPSVDEILHETRDINNSSPRMNSSYRQTRPLSPCPSEDPRSKLDHLLSIRRNIVESLNLLTTERQSLFQNHQNCYQEAKQFLHDQTRTRRRYRRANSIDKDDRNYHRYHTINDVPRHRYCHELSNPSDNISSQEAMAVHSSHSSPTYYKADRWLYSPPIQNNKATELSMHSPSRNYEFENNRIPTNLRHQDFTRKSETPGAYQHRDDFLERSWPRRCTTDVSKANADIDNYLCMVEESDTPVSGHVKSLSSGRFYDYNSQQIGFGHQYERPPEMVPARTQINHRFERDRTLSSDSIKQTSMAGNEVKVKRTPSFNQEVNQLKLQLSNPRRAETRESFDDKSSSLLSSDADSDFLFYPCPSLMSSPQIPVLTPSLQCVSDLSCPSDELGSALRARDEYAFGNSLDDITRQFYLDDDALSDDVFVDEYQGQTRADNSLENWYHFLNNSRCHSERQQSESSVYANIAQTYPRNYRTGSAEARPLIDSREVSPQPTSQNIVLRPTKNKEDELFGNDNSDIEHVHGENKDDLNNSAECEDLCSELADFNLNLANAFDSLRRNSTQSKSRRLWKERRTRMKKSPARHFRQLTPRFDISATENQENNRIFTFDSVDSTPASKDNSPSIKKPLKGILKNKVDSPISTPERPFTPEETGVEYDFCDIQEVDNMSPECCEEVDKDEKQGGDDQSSIMIVPEYKMNDSLSLSSNDISKPKYISVGVQVNLLDGFQMDLDGRIASYTNTVHCAELENAIVSNKHASVAENPVSASMPIKDSKDNISSENTDTPINVTCTDNLEDLDKEDCSEKHYETVSNQSPENHDSGPACCHQQDEGETEKKLEAKYSNNSCLESHLKQETSSDLVEADKAETENVFDTSQSEDSIPGKGADNKNPGSEVLVSKDGHEFHYLLSPTETGTTETIAVRKNSLEVYKWTRSWQRRAKNQSRKAANRSFRSGETSLDGKLDTEAKNTTIDLTKSEQKEVEKVNSD